MPKIRRFPVFGKRFFRLARKLVGSCHFSHFFRAVITLAAANGRRTLSKIEEASDAHRSRQSIAFFLTQAQWDAPQLLQETALATLKQLGWKLGESVYIVLDDTQKRKRAKRMDAVSKIFLHAEKVFAQGHTIVCCVLIYRGVVIPYAVRLCQWTRSLTRLVNPKCYELDVVWSPFLVLGLMWFERTGGKRASHRQSASR